MSNVELKLNEIFSGNYGLGIKELDEKSLQTLKELPEQQSFDILVEFEKMLNESGKDLEDPVILLKKMVERALTEVTRQGGLAEEVNQRLDDLFETGFCAPDDLNQQCLQMLSSMPPRDAVAAIDELEAADSSKTHNVSAFLLSVLSKYNQQPLAAKEVKETPEEMCLDRAPTCLPVELLYGYSDREYIPEMPRLLDGARLLPAIQDVLEHLIAEGSVQPEDVDERLLHKMRGIPPHAAAAVAKELMSVGNATNVRTMSAYIYGVMKRTTDRVAKEGAPQEHYFAQPYSMKRPRSPSPDVYAPRRPQEESMGFAGRKATREMIDEVVGFYVSMGKIANDDINEDARKYLASLDVNMMRKVVEEFCKKDMGRIHNKTSFLVGIAKKTVL